MGDLETIDRLTKERDEARADVATLTKWDERKVQRIAELEEYLRGLMDQAELNRCFDCSGIAGRHDPGCGLAALFKPAPAKQAQCCKRDTNHDGDCDRHPRR